VKPLINNMIPEISRCRCVRCMCKYDLLLEDSVFDNTKNVLLGVSDAIRATFDLPVVDFPVDFPRGQKMFYYDFCLWCDPTFGQGFPPWR